MIVVVHFVMCYVISVARALNKIIYGIKINKMRASINFDSAL